MHLQLAFHYVEPGVIERILSANALSLLNDQKLLDEILAFIAHLIELVVFEVVVSALNLAEDFGCVLALERQISTDQGVQDNTEGPDISLLRVGSFQHLR